MGFLDPNSWANALSDDPTGAKAAAGTQAEWQNRAIDLEQKRYEEGTQRQLPWLQAGTTAVNRLASDIAPGGRFSTTPSFKFDPASVNLLSDPGYKFRLQSGADAITAAGSAAGNLGSGNLLTALTRYGQDLGSQEYGAAYTRDYGRALDEYNAALQNQNTLYNRLAGISGTGQVTAGNIAGQGLTSAASTGNRMAGIGAGYGNAAVANRFLQSQAQGQLGQQAGQGLGNWLMADSGYQWEDTAGSGNYVDTSNAGNLWNEFSNWWNS